MSGVFGVAGMRDGVAYSEAKGSRSSCVQGHTWEISPTGMVTLLPDPPPCVIPERIRIPVFDEWVDINQIMCPDRSRFDVLREELPKCKTKAEVRTWLRREDFDRRYPLIPDSLSEVDLARG